jgi:hypothetical protein
MTSKSCAASRNIAAGAICWGALAAMVHAANGPAAEDAPPKVPAVQAETLGLPTMTAEAPAAGRRVRQTPPEYAGTDVHHSLYLPPDWRPDGKASGKRWPVIVEYTGNHAPGLGSTGEVAGAALGFGLCGGQGYIWVVMPYIARDHRHNQPTWWGDEESTVQYCKTNLPRICEAYGGDRRAVVLCGFSRGAIGVNYIGLHDDQIAALWAGFVTHDHYDGVLEWKGQSWGSPLATYQAEARKRLKRLQGRPVLVCQNGADGTQATRRFIGAQLDEARFTFLDVPVLSHDPQPVVHQRPYRPLAAPRQPLPASSLAVDGRDRVRCSACRRPLIGRFKAHLSPYRPAVKDLRDSPRYLLPGRRWAFIIKMVPPALVSGGKTRPTIAARASCSPPGLPPRGKHGP